MADAPGISRIIKPLARAKRLQSRELSDIRNHIGGFRVVKRHGLVIACAELKVMDPRRIAEVWSLAVAKRSENCGYEEPLLREIVTEAQALGLEKIFTVSDRIAILEKMGFFVPATGEKNILFFYPQEMGIPEVAGGLNIEIRPAQLSELGLIYQMIKEASGQSRVLPRRPREIESLIIQSCSLVAELEGQIIGHICLDIYNEEQAEVRSFLVAPGFTGQKVGKKLIAGICQEAQRRNLTELMTVTRQVKIFREMGFSFATRLLTEARWVYPAPRT